MTPWSPLRPPGPAAARRQGRGRRPQRSRAAPNGSERGLDVLRGWDLDPVAAPHVLDTHPELDYLAGTDEDRARDLQEAWCDPSVDAVLCARGGYGAQRMVDLLDWDAMRAAGPKVFVGYSDITALHEAFALAAGLSTLHGPMAAAEIFLKDARHPEPLRSTLFEPESVQTLGLDTAVALVPGTGPGRHPRRLRQPARRRPRHPARPDRRPAAGCCCSRTSGRSRTGSTGILTQLLRSGWLDGVAGVALGSWAGCGPYEEVRAVLADRLGGLGVPVVEELGFGHGPTALTVPLGVPAVLDAPADGGRCTLTSQVPALV